MNDEKNMNGNGKKDRILIVDDAPGNIRVLAELLKKDYSIMIEQNGPDALRAVRCGPPPDLILLDVVMPKMDGYEVCRTLKEDPATRNIPVLFVTSQSDFGHEEKGLSLGAVDYISKPFIPSLVKARVDAQLELKRHRDNLDKLVRERTRELTLTQDFIITALATLAEWRDPNAAEHLRRTRSYVQMLAQDLQKDSKFFADLSDDLVEVLSMVTPLHDIGKICIPDAILLKPGPLTPQEYEVMKQHPIYARDVLQTASAEIEHHIFLRAASNIAYSHHERWDGRGYPEGISGEAIPLVARIMSLADVYDALTSRRVYKPPMSHREAVILILAGRGTQFDPDIVDAFIRREAEFSKIAGENTE